MIFIDTVPTYDESLTVDVTVIEESLKHWNISAQIVVSSLHQDPIRATRIVISGIHKHHAVSDLTQFTLDTQQHLFSTQLDSCIDHRFDIVGFSTHSTHISNLTLNDCDAYTPCRFSSRIPDAILDDTVRGVLHLEHPGTELAVEVRHSSKGIPFFIPFQCDSSPNQIYFRTITPYEFARLYFASADPQVVRACQHLLMSDATYSRLSGAACPWLVSQAIVKAIIDQQFHEVFEIPNSTPQVARCLLIKLLPTAEDWKACYALDKDTNYLISRLTKDPTPLEEKEIHNVHKAYW